MMLTGNQAANGENKRQPNIERNRATQLNKIPDSLPLRPLKVIPIKFRRFVDSKGWKGLVINSQFHPDILY